MNLLFHRVNRDDGTYIVINANGVNYDDTVSNFIVDSGNVFVDSIEGEVQVWDNEKRCLISNGDTLPITDEYYNDTLNLLTNIQTIKNNQIDRIALGEREVELSITPNTITSNGVDVATLTMQLKTGVKSDGLRDDVLGQDVQMLLRIYETSETIDTPYLTDSNGLVTVEFTSIQAGTYQFTDILHKSNLVELVVT